MKDPNTPRRQHGSPLDDLERLTLAQLQDRLRLIEGMPEGAVPAVAAAVYYYLPFPPALRAAWATSLRQTTTLAGMLLSLEQGPEGEDPDYGKSIRGLFTAVLALRDAPGGIFDDHKPLVEADSMGTVVALVGQETTLWADAPTRVRGHFLIVAIGQLDQSGTSRNGAYQIVCNVLHLVEGGVIVSSSVKRQFNRAKRGVKAPKTEEISEAPKEEAA